MRILKEVALAGFVIALTFSATAYLAFAQTPIPSGMPFAGYVATYVPPNPACSAGHSVIFDYVTFTIIGVAIIPGSSEIYANGKVAVNGSALLGTYVPAAIPCLLPYPIFPIAQVGTS